MNTGIWRLTVRGEFAAAHALRHYYGKCEDLHGHNYSVEMVVEGNSLTEESELLVDFSTLKAELNLELSELDHKYLNKISPFTTINPSSENLARYLYEKMTLRLKNEPIKLYSITVGETSKQSATYMEIYPETK